MQPFLAGKKINLCGLTPAHIQPGTPYYAWLDDLSLDLYSERSYFPNTPTRMESYFESANTRSKLILMGIFNVQEQAHIGNITLQELDWINKRAFLGYLIGDKNFTGKGIATEASLMMMYYAFNKLNFERVWTSVSAEHAASQKVAAKSGLVLEGTLRGHQQRNGKRHNLNLYGALRTEWMEEFGPRASEAFSQLPV